MKIQVLGSGCPTCKKLNDITVQAVKELGLTDNVKYTHLTPVCNFYVGNS